MTIFNNFQNQSSRIDQVMSSSLQLARNQTKESDSLRDQAVSIVQQLDNMLDSLSRTDQQTIVSIEELLMNVEDEITDADIENMYNALNSRLEAQKVRRENLERNLLDLELTLEHLRYLNSTLPNLDCDG